MRSLVGRKPARSRPGLLAAVIMLWILLAAVALTGVLIIAFTKEHSAHFKVPLRIYPVTQELTGQCQAGTQGVNGPGTCYQVAQGITIRQVIDIHVERAKPGGNYQISISLTPADSRALARLTKASAGRDFALIVGDRLVAAPRVDAPITKGRILITGELTKPAADNIMAQLKA